MTRCNFSRNSGVASVELAIVLPVFIIVLAGVIYFCVYLMYYTVVNKAAQSAARYFATISQAEMKSPVLMASALSATESMARDMLADVKSDSTIVGVLCDTNICGTTTALPAKITVTVSVRYNDVFFGTYQSDYGAPITARYTMAYAGYR